jgi:hypothetical protein
MNGRVMSLWSSVAVCGLSASLAHAGGLTGGNLVVVRVGDGAAALSNAASAVFLEERLPTNGSVVDTLPLPTVVTGANRRLVVAGSATSESYLTLATNGEYLVMFGYDAPVGQPTVSATTSAVANRVIGRVAVADGSINTTTALSDLSYNAGNPRSVVTDDGTRFWCSGTGSPASNGGIRFVSALGGSTSEAVATAPTNTRVINIFNDGTQEQLFISSASTTFQGISAVGSGLPSSGFPVTVTPLNGFPTTTGPSNYDYYFANPTTIYVADDRTLPNGGIQKWTLTKGTWTLAYTLNTDLTTGCRGLTGAVSAEGDTVLYATTASGSANNIVTVTDTGATSPFTVLATAPTNTVFRGIRLIPDITPPTCSGDTDADGDVDADDLTAVILQWGNTCPCTGDVDADNDVDADDLTLVILNWGDCP